MATRRPDLSIGTPESFWPFSKGLVAESLLNAGVSPQTASAAARGLETQLLRRAQQDGQGFTSVPELKALMVAAARPFVDGETLARVERQTAVFEDILVQTPKRALPFSRGVLARSLEDTGLGPREAYAVAGVIDTRLRRAGVKDIPADDIDDLTETVLRERHGEQMRLTYRFLRANRGRLGVLGSEGGAPVPFSKGVLVQSLLAAGMAPDYARKVARTTQRQLRGTEDRVVTRRAVRDKVEELLREDNGPEVAARYRLLRVIRRPPRPLIVLLGGVSGTGKSVLAAEIAYRLGIPRVISTDAIREVMRAMVSRELTPTLHASTFNAWEQLIPPETERPAHPGERLLLSGFREQVQQVSVGLAAVVRRSVEEGSSAVLEGVHLVPGYLPTFPGAIVVPLLITLPSGEEHRRHFESREAETGSARPQHRYMQYFEEIRAMQRYLEGLAQRGGVPVLDGLSVDESADRAVELVMQRVLALLTAEERAALLGEMAEQVTLG